MPSKSVNYSCPTGFIVDGSTCTQSQTEAASASYSCPAGTTVSGANCIATVAAASSGGGAGMTCLPPTEVCVDASPATRTVGGVQVTHDCGSAFERVPINLRDNYLLEFEKIGLSGVPIGAGRAPSNVLLPVFNQ
jgi:hypothetical protein